ncbi:PH domain-containing protein [Nocardioides sp. TF02-7]|uniref:PH domain-containing protein n=1 Tax=Nocardioides sp. TF02-7 TaxID=2917724 RepID=UPI001F0529EF|nr:PH domain-containing protein [Nocardioides sp. TF02-7]UMG92604.1 PH domain-containing protein [Nocardioides sp. TF02-7]
MPAASEPGAVPDLPRTWRPFGPRIAGIVFAFVLVGAFAGLWISFPQQTKEDVGILQRATVVAFVGVGVLLLLALARSRITATTDGLVVVNGFRKRRYEWAEVIAVRMPPGAPWPQLDLADGTTVSALGIHGSDGARARTAVQELRAVLAATDPQE